MLYYLAMMSENADTSPASDQDENGGSRVRMHLYNSKKSWSLIDGKADKEVLMEMGMSLLNYDDSETHSDSKISTNMACSSKRSLADIENINPNVNRASPRTLTPKSPKSGLSHSKSPESTEKYKSRTHTSHVEVDSGIPDEETPSGQSVSSEYHKIYASTLDSGSNCRKRRASYSDLDNSSAVVECKASRCDGADAFSELSDEMMLSIFWWLPKLTLQNCMLVNKRWLRIASDETLWPRLDLSKKVLTKDALGNILSRKPILLRMYYTEISEWSPQNTPLQSKLQYLDLSMATISIDTLEKLLATCTQLKKLSLENVPLSDDVCRIVGRCTQLETLNLTMALGIQSEGALRLAQGCTALLSLNISWCYLSEAALYNLVANISPTVQRLNIAGSRLLTDEMVAILVRSCPRLLELDLSDCSRLTDDSITTLMSLRRLEHLALSRCYLLQPDTLVLLNEMPSLIYLDVFGMLTSSTLNTLKTSMREIQINQFRFSAVARPTVGVKRTSIWGLKTRD